jgi:hypothetical protein
MKANIYIFCANRRRVSDRTRQSVVLCFFKNVRRVSNIATRKQLASARGLTLGEATSAVYLFPEWATLNATLENDVTQCFWPSAIALALIVFRLSRSGWLFSTYQSK